MTQFLKNAELSIPSGRLCISDSSYFFDFPLVVELPPGVYNVESRSAIIEGHTVVERLRVVDDRGDGHARGELLGYVQVEFAQLGLCDQTELSEAYASASDADINVFTSQFQTSGTTGLARFPAGATMILVKPGFGDLEPAVYELLRNGARVGVEAVFMEPDARPPL